MAPVLSLTQLQYTTAGLLATPSHRQDGRDLLSFRPLQIATSSTSQQAVGSAQCSLAGTRSSVVISAEVVQDDDARSSSSFINCSVDVDDCVAPSMNLNTLLITLQRALVNALRSTFDQEQLVILRSAEHPHQVTRAWRLHVDALVHDVSGGNVADCLVACTYAALRDVRLPKTRAIGFDVASLSNVSDPARTDIFDVRGSRTRTDKTTSKHSTIASDQSGQPDKAGVDFEILDVGGHGSESLHEAKSFPVGVTINILADGKSLMLDASQTEEACLPYARRLFVLCNPSNGQLAGTYMLTASLETGANQLGEERNAKTESLVGTSSYEAVRHAVEAGQRYAKELHDVIEAQIDGATQQIDDVQMTKAK